MSMKIVKIRWHFDYCYWYSEDKRYRISSSRRACWYTERFDDEAGKYVPLSWNTSLAKAKKAVEFYILKQGLTCKDCLQVEGNSQGSAP